MLRRVRAPQHLVNWRQRALDRSRNLVVPSTAVEDIRCSLPHFSACRKVGFCYRRRSFLVKQQRGPEWSSSRWEVDYLFGEFIFSHSLFLLSAKNLSG